VKRTPLDIEGVPRWQIAQDKATGTMVVSTGIRSAIQSVGRDGRFEIDRTGRASVSAATPEAARVEGEATIRLQTPQGSNVIVQSRLRVTQDGQDFRASVTVDGQLVFERQWGDGRTETSDERIDGDRSGAGSATSKAVSGQPAGTDGAPADPRVSF